MIRDTRALHACCTEGGLGRNVARMLWKARLERRDGGVIDFQSGRI